MIAGISFWNFYFRFHAGAIRGPQFVEFLQALVKQLRGKLLVIWDGLPAHRSRVVKDYVEGLDGHLILERLPAYVRTGTQSRRIHLGLPEATRVGQPLPEHHRRGEPLCP